MEDNRIVDLYWARSEDAITETSEKYGKYCYAIAYNILSNAEDAEESVNDTYMETWKAIPPQRPRYFRRTVRPFSLRSWEKSPAEYPLISGGGVPQISVAAAKLCWRLMNWRNVFRPAIG